MAGLTNQVNIWHSDPDAPLDMLDNGCLYTNLILTPTLEKGLGHN